MRALKIQIRSREEAHAEFASVFKRLQAGKRVVAKQATYFTSLDAVRALLTDRRLELLHLIREHEPRSISELAKIARRDFKNVHADVMLLKRYDLVAMTAGEKGGKTARRGLSVPYQAIDIHAVV